MRHKIANNCGCVNWCLLKRCAIPRHGGGGYVQGHLREAHQTHFSHGQLRVSPELIAA